MLSKLRGEKEPINGGDMAAHGVWFRRTSGLIVIYLLMYGSGPACRDPKSQTQNPIDPYIPLHKPYKPR